MIVARDKNTLAIASLTIALTRAQDENMILRAVSEAWPEGIAWMIMEKLKQKYHPDDNTAGLERTRDIRDIKMSDDDDPDMLVNQVTTINNRYA